MPHFSRALEEAIRSRLQERPGCLDNTLVNSKGLRYVQAQHGDDPLAAGFDICVSASVAPKRRAPPDAWWIFKAALLSALAFVVYRVGLLRTRRN